MATRKIAFGTFTSFGLASNINSLANNAAKPLGEVSNVSDLAINAKLYLELTLGSSGVSSTGTLELYLLESRDGAASEWSDGIDSEATSDQASSLKNAKLLAVLNANANNQVVRYQADLIGLGFPPVTAMPKYWTLLLVNKSGAALHASAHEAQYSHITETVA